MTQHPFVQFYKKFYEAGNVKALEIDKEDDHKKAMQLIVEMQNNLTVNCYVCSGWGHISTDRQK